MTLPRFLLSLLFISIFSFFLYAMFNFISISPTETVKRETAEESFGEAPPEIAEAEPVVIEPVPQPRLAAPSSPSEPEPDMMAPAPEPDIVLAEPIFEESVVTRQELGEFHLVSLFFATNRELSTNSNPDTPAEQFTAEDGNLLYGIAEVSIPKNHQIGHLESQGRIASLFFDPDPKKHVILRAMNVMEEADVFTQLSSLLESGEQSTLFYIHGYNTGVDTAARRAGQLTYDLNWNGPSFFFSWPSQNRFADYGNDQEKARGSRNELQSVFERIAETETDRIVVIAHSMGTDLLTQTFELMEARNSPALEKIKTVILAAPDINATNFIEDIVPVIDKIDDDNPDFKVTLYASAADSALQISEVTNGVLRIGAMSQVSDDEILAISPVQIVDASTAVTNFFGHTYINDNPTVIADVYCILQNRPSPSARATLEGVPDLENGPQYRIRPTITQASILTDSAEREGSVDNAAPAPHFRCE